MAGAPIFRRWTRAAPGALDVFALATDDITAETNYLLSEMTDLQDLVSDPDPGALRYEIRLFKNGIDSGRAFFSQGLNPGSAGRVAVGPLRMKPGKVSFSVAQRAGALTAYSFVSKFSNP